MVKFQNLALHAFSDPIPLPVTPVGKTDAAENAREAEENQANRDRQRFDEQERTGYVMRLFKKGMPKYIRAKLLEKEDSKTSVQDLCTIARQPLILRELYPADEFSGINAIESESIPQLDRLIAVMAEWSKQKSELDSKVDELTKQKKEQNETFKNQRDTSKNSQQDSNQNNRRNNRRGNNKGGYRGRNRGYYNKKSGFNPNWGIVNLSTPGTGITTDIIRTNIPGHRISISRMVNKTSKTLKLWKQSKMVISR